MQIRTVLNTSALLVLLTISLGWASATVANDGNIVVDIERLATMSDLEQQQAADSLLVRIQADTAAAIEAILPKLTDTTISQNSLGMFVSALGTTKSPRVVGDICKVAESHKAGDIRSRCWLALAEIGTEEAGKCLLSSLDYVTDKEERFAVFNALSQIQYAPAVPLTLEILKSNAQEESWRVMFVFGKMGDVAIPYLIERIGDGDKNVRSNAIGVLGSWLMAAEATQALQDQFWKEKDPIIRNLILSSLERTCSNQQALSAFMKDVESRSKDENAKKFAEESLALLKEQSDQMTEAEARKKISSEQFDLAYREIWESYGHDGDYEMLLASSSLDDEPALKKLRERILQRNSDESFYDYNKVNDIIYVNRVLYGQI